MLLQRHLSVKVYVYLAGDDIVMGHLDFFGGGLTFR